MIHKLAKEAGFFVKDDEIYTSKLEHLPITKDLEQFAKLVIKQYKQEERKSRKELKSKLGYSRIGLNNI
jgi:hypothetical protein